MSLFGYRYTRQKFLDAIRDDDVETVRKYLSSPSKAKKWLAVEKGGKNVPLYAAIDSVRNNVFDMLIAAGADINGRQSKEHVFPATYAIGKINDIMAGHIIKNHFDRLSGDHCVQMLTKALDEKNRNIALMLMKTERYDLRQWLEVHINKKEKNFGIINLLAEGGAPRDRAYYDPTFKGEVFLINLAALHENMPLLKLTLKDGFIDAPDIDGDTPLHNAAIRNNHDMIRVLIAAGARTDIRNLKGLTAREAAGDPETAELIDKITGAVPAPALPPDAADGDREQWQLMGADRIIFTGEYPAAKQHIKEIFNFTAQDKISTVTDLATGKEVTVRTPFSELGNRDISRAFNAYRDAGGDMDEQTACLPDMGPRYINVRKEMGG